MLLTLFQTAADGVASGRVNIQLCCNVVTHGGGAGEGKLVGSGTGANSCRHLGLQTF